MISERLEKLLNEQLQKEFFSAYLYLSIEAYFASINLNGFAHWFRIQAQEERDHAIIFFNYITKAQGRVRLLPVTIMQSFSIRTRSHSSMYFLSILDIIMLLSHTNM